MPKEEKKSMPYRQECQRRRGGKQRGTGNQGGGGVQPNVLKYLAKVLSVAQTIFFMGTGMWALSIYAYDKA